MPLKLINIGFGNIVSASRVVAIVGPDAAPAVRIPTVHPKVPQNWLWLPIGHHLL